MIGSILRTAAQTLVAGLCLGLSVAHAQPTGQQLTALARLDAAGSQIVDDQDAVTMRLALSQPVPFRVYMLADPPRLVMDFRELAFDGVLPEAIEHSAHVTALRWGPFRPGWSRLVAELDRPFLVASAWQETQPTRINLRLRPTDAAGLAAVAAGPEALSGPWALPDPAEVALPKPRQDGTHALRVVLDPGHGGIDPGAQADGLVEKQLVLSFALELRDLLIRAGMEVELTRLEDVFVPLETRVTVARAMGADLFLSLHADALHEGEAQGATVYLMAPEASDQAAALLAERHDRDDLLSGVDLEGHDDQVAGVLMDLARVETGPRSERLAASLAEQFRAAGLRVHRHPVQRADFTVLKAPDIPSALLELGFLSSPDDRKRLIDPVWRTKAARAVLEALKDWAEKDAAEARLLRQ